VVGRPGAESPNIKDPHAAFRKGNTLKRLLLVALAGGLLAGLFYFLPGQQAAEAPQVAQGDLRDNAVIGSSLSPDVIVDPKNKPLAEQVDRTPPAEEPAAPPSAPQSADNTGFASAFKSQAK